MHVPEVTPDKGQSFSQRLLHSAVTWMPFSRWHLAAWDQAGVTKDEGRRDGKGPGLCCLHPCCQRSDKKTQRVMESRNPQRKPRGAKLSKAEDVLTVEHCAARLGTHCWLAWAVQPLTVAFSCLLCTQSPRALMKWQILIALVQGGA